MNAFDTDVFSEILLGHAAYVSRLSLIPADQQAIPIIVAEEILRGHLNVIRQAEARKSKISIDLAYQLFEETIRELRWLQILSYTSDAETAYQRWREEGIRISTHDLRIAAICSVHRATLISRNRRDFERVPGLAVEFWD
ncbi:MAG: type II toxin-antitoxin system VapC family toxin [Acidobacteriota bacterium]